VDSEIGDTDRLELDQIGLDQIRSARSMSDVSGLSAIVTASIHVNHVHPHSHHSTHAKAKYSVVGLSRG